MLIGNDLFYNVLIYSTFFNQAVQSISTSNVISYLINTIYTSKFIIFLKWFLINPLARAREVNIKLRVD